MRASALVVILVLLVRSLAAAEPGAAGQGVVQGAVQCAPTPCCASRSAPMWS